MRNSCWQMCFARQPFTNAFSELFAVISSVSPSGNFIYYGDIFGQISAWQVATFETKAPTGAPSPTPTGTPTAAPTSSPAPTVGHPTQQPTIVPTAAFVAPSGQTIFDTTGNALESGGGNDSGNDGTSMGVIIGAALAGLLVVTLVAFFVARSLLKPKKKKKTKSTARVTSGDVENDLEDSGDDVGSEASDQMDDVTVTSGADAVEVEVTPGSNMLQTPPAKTGRKKRKHKARTPPTPNTLASIEEVEDEEIIAGQDPKANLNDKFNAASRNDGEGSLQKGVAVAPSNLKPLADDALADDALEDDDSVDSEDSGSDPPPPPPPPPTSTKTSAEQSLENTEAEEEKKENEVSGPATPRTLSPQPSFGMESDATPLSSARSFLDAFTAAFTGAPPTTSEESSALPPARSATVPISPPSGHLTSTGSMSPGTATTTSQGSRALTPIRSAFVPASPLSEQWSPTGRMSPGVMSTDSSLYTDENKTITSVDRASPMSAVFGGTSEEGSLPDDEAESSAAIPSLNHTDISRDREGGIQVPGAQYLSKNYALRPKFKPSTVAKAPKVKSARTKRNLNGFSGTYLSAAEDAPGSDDEGRITSTATPALQSSTKGPSFKRRTKKEEKPQEASTGIEDTWNSFLKDLAAAEQQFFSPTHAQKSAVLRYNPDESFDDGTTVGDDDQTVKTGSTM